MKYVGLRVCLQGYPKELRYFIACGGALFTDNLIALCYFKSTENDLKTFIILITNNLLIFFLFNAYSWEIFLNIREIN